VVPNEQSGRAILETQSDAGSQCVALYFVLGEPGNRGRNRCGERALAACSQVPATPSYHTRWGGRPEGLLAKGLGGGYLGTQGANGTIAVGPFTALSAKRY
jgi:hypothetical protein